MDKKTEKKIEPYRLKAEWYEESDPLEIVVVLGGSKLAQATILTERLTWGFIHCARSYKEMDFTPAASSGSF